MHALRGTKLHYSRENVEAKRTDENGYSPNRISQSNDDLLVSPTYPPSPVIPSVARCVKHSAKQPSLDQTHREMPSLIDKTSVLHVSKMEEHVPQNAQANVGSELVNNPGRSVLPIDKFIDCVNDLQTSLQVADVTLGEIRRSHERIANWRPAWPDFDGISRSKRNSVLSPQINDASLVALSNENVAMAEAASIAKNDHDKSRSIERLATQVEASNLDEEMNSVHSADSFTLLRAESSSDDDVDQEPLASGNSDSDKHQEAAFLPSVSNATDTRHPLSVDESNEHAPGHANPPSKNDEKSPLFKVVCAGEQNTVNMGDIIVEPPVTDGHASVLKTGAETAPVQEQNARLTTKRVDTRPAQECSPLLDTGTEAQLKAIASQEKSDTLQAPIKDSQRKEEVTKGIPPAKITVGCESYPDRDQNMNYIRPSSVGDINRVQQHIATELPYFDDPFVAHRVDEDTFQPNFATSISPTLSTPQPWEYDKLNEPEDISAPGCDQLNIPVGGKRFESGHAENQKESSMSSSRVYRSNETVTKSVAKKISRQVELGSKDRCSSDVRKSNTGLSGMLERKVTPNASARTEEKRPIRKKYLHVPPTDRVVVPDRERPVSASINRRNVWQEEPSEARPTCKTVKDLLLSTLEQENSGKMNRLADSARSSSARRRMRASVVDVNRQYAFVQNREARPKSARDLDKLVWTRYWLDDNVPVDTEKRFADTEHEAAQSSPAQKEKALKKAIPLTPHTTVATKQTATGTKCNMGPIAPLPELWTVFSRVPCARKMGGREVGKRSLSSPLVTAKQTEAFRPIYQKRTAIPNKVKEMNLQDENVLGTSVTPCTVLLTNSRCSSAQSRHIVFVATSHGWKGDDEDIDCESISLNGSATDSEAELLAYAAAPRSKRPKSNSRRFGVNK